MRDILLLTVFIGLIPFVFVRPWIGVLVWSWIAYMNPHLLGWGFTHSLPIAKLFGGLTIGIMLLRKDRKPVPATRETAILVLLIIFFTIGTVTAWVPDEAWLEWNKVMKILLFTFVTMMLIFGHSRIRALLIVIALSVGFFGVKGGIFTLMTGGKYRVWGPAQSFIGDNNSLGLAMLMVVPLIVVLSMEARNKWFKAGGYVAAALTVVAIIFTYSRGDLLGLAAITSLAVLKSRKKLLLLMLIVPVALIGVSLVPQKLIDRAHTIKTYQLNASAMERIQAWGVAWNVALANPVLGAGFKFSYNQPRWLDYAMVKGGIWGNKSRVAHSIYFQMLGQHGFVGAFLFVALLIFTYRKFSKVRKVAKGSDGDAYLVRYATALQIGLVGYMTSGAFLSMAYFDLLYAFVALAVIMDRELRERSSSMALSTAQARPSQSRQLATG